MGIASCFEELPDDLQKLISNLMLWRGRGGIGSDLGRAEATEELGEWLGNEWGCSFEEYT